MKEFLKNSNCLKLIEKHPKNIQKFFKDLNTQIGTISDTQNQQENQLLLERILGFYSRLIGKYSYLKNELTTFLDGWSFMLSSTTTETLRDIYFILLHNERFGRYFKYKYQRLECLEGRYYLISVISIIYGLSSSEKSQVLKSEFTEEELKSVLSKVYQDYVERQEERQTMFSNLLEADSEDMDVDWPFPDLGNELVTPSADFVGLECTEGVLDEIKHAINCSLPVLLCGPTGVGKTTIVEEANKRFGSQELLKIHLGDQTDSKLLLGTYVSTSTAGVFKWQPGALTQAVTQGRWILVEDIDMAPVDVLAVLVPLLETRYLHVPTRGEKHEAKPGFMIFATTTETKSQTVGDNLWHKVTVPLMNPSQLLKLLKSRFPLLENHASGLLEAFTGLCAKIDLTNGIVNRLSIRDLIKWCTRLSELYQPADLENEVKCRELFFVEGLECFTAMYKPGPIKDMLERYFGSLLDISENRVDYLMLYQTPNIEVTEKQVKCGRVCLNRFKIVKEQEYFASTSLATRNLEKLAVSTFMNEPLLLVGETGTGKTTIVQRLAALTGHKLIVINMSQQSDITDLLGGFKPVDALMLATPIKESFETLFSKTFSVKQNGAFLESIAKAYRKQRWDQLLVGFQNAIKMAKTVKKNQTEKSSESKPQAKKKKLLQESIFIEWENFEIQVQQLGAQLQQVQSQFLFSFVEGSLVTALKNGYWILLDEINLATAETLECLSGLLQKATGSVLLLERGDTTPVPRHANFKLFACMNPANDAGKRDLPRGIRSRFTELWIDAPDSNMADLHLIIQRYLSRFMPPGSQGEELCADIGIFYKTANEYSLSGQLFDGSDSRVHISMRTLTRALTFAALIAPIYGIRRALYEGCFMTFMTGLNKNSFEMMKKLLFQYVLNTVRNPTAFIKQIPQEPSTTNVHVLLDSFWIEKGEFEIPEGVDDEFVLSPSVAANLCNLARACLSRKYPVLIQGPTSAGKTSMIEFLAKKTGHRFIRINNHEHTDLQEYIGGYMTNNEGRLVFQEGVLVEALRKGYWVVLDELNLAPSDVLEALNRLLDDNRELFLVEKQEVIKPHPHFMLFATQNPAGQYGGRKALSRAFRNRFLELHFTDIPEDELETIIEKKCLIAPSYAKKLVQVYRQLCKSRDASRIFDGRQSFITLRDLFRWALRRANGYEELARDGYMLIAEKVRKEADRAFILQILEKELRVKLDIKTLYQELFKDIITSIDVPHKESVLQKVVWTSQMQKNFVLMYKARIHREPVLLIGETGCGKTTVCQVLSELFNQKLHILNAHQNSETSDFLGGQRPCRSREQNEKALLEGLDEFLHSKELHSSSTMTAADVQEFVLSMKSKYPDDKSVYERLNSLLIKSKSLFEWYDGPLVQAMKQGDMFLLDEISLADDSVLERFNSVLEPARQLTLVENNDIDVVEIVAAPAFHFFATMNPGGDYGKKELSPALRNRFTEIWVPQVSNIEDLLLIIKNNLAELGSYAEDIALKILTFLKWFAEYLQKPLETIVSLRDILAWSGFIKSVSDKISLQIAYFHGGCMVLVDGIGVNPLYGVLKSPVEAITLARQKLIEIANITEDTFSNLTVELTKEYFGVSPFVIPFGNCEPRNDVQFSLSAPTTLQNCIRVLRAIQLKKPVLLEGSPGAGKTSLISSMAALSQNRLTRINLSEQTDLMDLFGSDLPVEGGHGGEFAWRDGPFLKAMQDGQWVLLDELNLASQQVLEGLNACLDHRATVYIPELDKHFTCHPDFRVFAAQNPQSQGGGRKGLPKSFVNRFTLVYVQELNRDDLKVICSSLYPKLDQTIVEQIIDFNLELKVQTMDLRKFGWAGSPWEFNLRDILRWLELWQVNFASAEPADFLGTLYLQRMRTANDRKCVLNIFEGVFGFTPNVQSPPFYSVTNDFIFVGNQIHQRKNVRGLHLHSVPVDQLQILPSKLSILESLLRCVNTNTMALLIGPAASGKSSMIRLLASLCGEKLVEFSMNPGVDALELLGGFEQVDFTRRKQQLLEVLENVLERTRRHLFLSKNHEDLEKLTDFWDSILKADEVIFVSSISQLLISLKSIITSEELDLIRDMLQGYQTLLKTSAQGRFEWMDSCLVQALEFGHWILIDNVNLCSSSVLDRLNSLLEVGGNLTMSERGLVNGQVKCISPHPNFRIFMAMDPRHGEISRAMRNRAIELYVETFEESDESRLLQNMKLLYNLGLPGPTFAKQMKMLDSHDSLSTTNLKVMVDKFVNGLGFPEYFQPEGGLPELSAPTMWPDYVPGSLIATNSIFADVMLKGSVLFHFLADRDVQFYAAKVDRIPERKLLVIAALKEFSKHWSISNDGYITGYLNFLERKFVDLADLIPELGYNGFLVNKELMQLRQNILLENGLNDLDDVLPLDLTNSCLNLSRSNDYQAYVVSLGKSYINNRIVYAIEQENVCYDDIPEQRRTVAQVSYLVHKRVIRVSTLEHQSIQYLYPILTQLAEVALRDDTALDAKLTLTDMRSNLFESLQTTEYQYDLVVVAIRKILKYLEKSVLIAESFEELQIQLAAYMNSISMSNYRYSQLFWRKNRSVSLSKQSLWDISNELKRIDAKMDIWHVNSNDWFKLTVNWRKWTEKKLMCVEAMSTLYFLNDQEEMDPELFELMKSVPSKIGIDDTNEVEKSFQTVDSAQEMCTLFMMWPIQDSRCIFTELALVDQLCSLLNGKINTSFLSSSLQDYLTHAIETASFSPLHFEPIQRLSWFYDNPPNEISNEESKLFLKSILNDAILHWHRGLWNNGHSFWSKYLHDETISSITSGAIAPILLDQVNFEYNQSGLVSYPPFVTGQSAIILSMIGNMEKVPLYSISSKSTQLKKLRVELSSSWPTLDEIWQHDTNILTYLINDYLNHITDAAGNDVIVSISEKLEQAIKMTSNESIKKQLDFIAKGLPRLNDSIANRGLLWIANSMVFLHSYIPDFPIDPVATKLAKLKFLQKALDERLARFIVECETEFFNRGSFVEPTDLAEQIDSLKKKEHRLKNKLPLRPENSQIMEIFAELQNLKTAIFDFKSIDNLVKSLTAKEKAQRRFGAQKEDSLQSVLDSVIAKFSINFPFYGDILSPIISAMYQLKYGLLLVRQSVDQEAFGHLDSLTEKLLDFTAPVSAQSLQRMIIETDAVAAESSADKINFLNVRLAILESFTLQQRYDPHHMGEGKKLIVEILHAIADDWTDAEERRVRLLEEEKSIYKVRSETITTDEEQEELELKSMFPDYSADFIGEEDQEKEKKPTKGKDILYDGKKAHEIVALFSRLSDSFTPTKQNDFTVNWTRNFNSNFFAMVKLLNAEKRVTGAKVDSIAMPGFLFISKSSHDLIERPQEFGSEQLYDFYVDPNMYEAKRLVPVLMKYEAAVLRALAQWADHAVLVKLLEICRRILSCAAFSPIIKLLTGLEMLMMASEDWQAYTSKDLSLKAELDEIVKLIVSWRKLELDTWKELLAIEDRKCAQSVSSQWFTLWSLINRTLDSNELDDQIKMLILQKLDAYCLDSTIGEFGAKLELLKKFYRFIQAVKPSENNFIQSLLWNLIGYYSQFLLLVQNTVEKVKAPIQKELRGYVQIASWKDINVYALKESAKRTHYHLNKYVKKYRLGIQLKLQDLISSFQNDPPRPTQTTENLENLINSLSLNAANFNSKVVLHTSKTQFTNGSKIKKVADLPKLFEKAKNIGQVLLVDQYDINHITGLEQLGAELLSQIEDFRNVNNNIQTGEVKANGQKTFRKKCWVDFLKLLQFIGLHPRCSQKYANQQDHVFIYTQADLDFSTIQSIIESTVNFNSHVGDVISKADNYHFRNIALLNSIRALKANRSPDISLLELEKSVSYLDHLMHFSLEQRRLLANFNPTLDNIKFVYQQLKKYDTSPGLVMEDQDYTGLFNFWKSRLPSLWMTVQKVLLALGAVELNDESLVRLKGFLVKCEQGLYQNKCEIEANSHPLLPVTFLKTLPFKSLLDSNEKLTRSLNQELNQVTLKQVLLLTKPLLVLSECILNDLSTNPCAQPTVTREVYEALIDSCLDKVLISIQHLIKTQPVEGRPNDFNVGESFDIDFNGLLASNERLSSPLSSKALQSLPGEVLAVMKATSNLSDLSSEDFEVVNNQLKSLFALIEQFWLMLNYRLYELLLFHKTLVKFAYILSKTFSSIIKNGFCVPVEEEEQDDGDTEENATGLGVGEGEGKKDVSDEIEDQGEVEDLQNDQQKDSSKPEKNMEEEDNGVEMDHDFEGDLEEVDEKEDPDQEKERQDNADEQMGKVDEDLADTVDEKMWGDEDQSKSNENEKTEKDAEVENKGGESELAANEEQSNSNEKQEKDKHSQEEKKEMADDENSEAINEAENFEENQGVDMKQADDNVNNDEEDDMDLPDELQLDGSDAGNDAQDFNDMDTEDKPGVDEDDRVQDMPDFPEESHIPETEDNPLPAVDGDPSEPVEDMDKAEDDNAMDQDELENEGPDCDSENEQANTNPAHGLGEENPEPEVDDQDQDNDDENAASAKNSTQEHNYASKDTFGVDGASGLESKAKDDPNDDGPGEEADLDQDPNEMMVRNEEGNERGSQSQPKEASEPKNADSSSQTNPHRSVGSAMEKWLSRLRNISESDEKASNEPSKTENNSGENDDFEFVKENDLDQGDNQALGIADQDQVEKMDKQALGEQETNDEYEPMELDDPVHDPPLKESSNENVNEIKGLNGQTQFKELDEEEGNEPGERATTELDEKDEVEKENVELVRQKFERALSAEYEKIEIENDQSIEILDYDTFRHDLEQRMAKWREQGRDPAVGQELWRNYSALTRDLSFTLCEQLRLILEPTQSTKLKGDYRTGKRLNMRKVISYIASQFKKDKIWLRRTKPSKRTYQVMISIDDSLSMASSHSVQLAFESLTVITTALNQLEVGDIAVVSFGEDVKLVHPFEKSWSDEAGGEALSWFTFAQERTRVKLLMDQSLEVLRHARMSQSSQDLWQLQIILSDGICEDHEYVRNRVHLAAEEQIAMVFVVLDTRSEKDSILSLTNVSYDFDPVTNVPKLKMQRYMDTFPFDYYVIVKNVEDLPEILSDTLRQFFAFASA